MRYFTQERQTPAGEEVTGLVSWCIVVTGFDPAGSAGPLPNSRTTRLTCAPALAQTSRSALSVAPVLCTDVTISVRSCPVESAAMELKRC